MIMTAREPFVDVATPRCDMSWPGKGTQFATLRARADTEVTKVIDRRDTTRLIHLGSMYMYEQWFMLLHGYAKWFSPFQKSVVECSLCN